MVHVFSELGQLLALDVGSGALHQLDPLAYDALASLCGGTVPEAVPAALEGRYGRAEVAEALAELMELKDQGLLFSDDGVDPAQAENHSTVVKAMCLHAAHDCNLRCQYCFAATGDFQMGHRMLLPLETGKRALEWLIAKSGSRRALEVDFFGGEPLMNFEVVRELVLYGRQLEKEHDKRFSFTITTNGLGLTDENTDFINEQMDNVVLSLDGRPEVHDRMRPTANGRGSYDLVLPKMRRLVEKRKGGQYYVRGTFSAHNLDFGKDVMALYGAGFEQVSVEPVVADPAVDYAITPEMLPEVLAEYEWLAEEYAALLRRGEFMNFFHFNADLDAGPCLKKRLMGCGAGNEYVAVTPEGDIYPCHQFVGREGFRMGSVLDGAFDNGMQRHFKKNHVLNKPECGGCWAKFLCSGGCAANAHAFAGDIHTPNPLECEMQKKRLSCALALHAMRRTGQLKPTVTNEEEAQ